jgi:hypothetical protein
MRALFVIGLLAVAVVPGTAEARDRSSFELSFDVREHWYRSMPRLSLTGTQETWLRTIEGGELPSTGSQHFLAAFLDSGFIANDRLEFPVFGIGGAGAIGSSPRVITSLDGSMIELKPWTTGMVNFLLPGVGVRFKERRWMFAARARFSGTILWMSGAVAAGGDVIPLDSSPTATGFGIRAEVEVCRRMDPTNRLCLLVSPHVLEFGVMNGGSVGLRWEIGP